jgi:hypothetical protein
MNASWYESTFVGVAGRAPACVPGSSRRVTLGSSVNRRSFGLMNLPNDRRCTVGVGEGAMAGLHQRFARLAG